MEECSSLRFSVASEDHHQVPPSEGSRRVPPALGLLETVPNTYCLGFPGSYFFGTLGDPQNGDLSENLVNHDAADL